MKDSRILLAFPLILTGFSGFVIGVIQTHKYPAGHPYITYCAVSIFLIAAGILFARYCLVKIRPKERDGTVKKKADFDWLVESQEPSSPQKLLEEDYFGGYPGDEYIFSFFSRKKS